MTGQRFAAVGLGECFIDYKSAILVQDTQLTFHRRARRNAFRHRGAHPRSRLFTLQGRQPRPTPKSNRHREIVSNDFPILHRDGSCLFCAPHGNANLSASRRRFRLKMNCHGFPTPCDHKYLFNHRLDRFDHRLDRFDHHLSERCSALGCINALANWFAAIQSTFKSAAGTVANSHPHSRACIKSNTHSYADSQPDTITKRSTCRHALPTFTPSQIAIISSASDSRFRMQLHAQTPAQVPRPGCCR
jgi:hypothetical protein